MNQIVQSIGQVSIFGPCDTSAIQSVETEQREKERLRQKELKKRIHEQEKADAERKKQEEEDFLFCLQEEKKLSSSQSQHSPSRGSVGGRGTRLREYLEPDALPRGRGRLPELQDARKTHKRNIDKHIRNHLDQFVGENVYSNRRQEMFWQGEKPFGNYSNLNTNSDREKYYPTESDFLEDSSNCHTEACSNEVEAYPSSCHFETADPTLKYSDNLTYTTDQEPKHQSLYPDSACGPDQFKDVEDDILLTSVKQESSKIQSRSSFSSTSPIQHKACSSLGIKKPKPRLISFLSNKIKSASEDPQVSNYDYFREQSSNVHPVASAASRSSGVPINSLNASQRVIGDVGIRTSDISRNYNHFSETDKEFRINENEFPPL